jgi:hypothetical protein
VFLAALRNSGNVRAACHAAGISRPQAYGHRERVPAFAAAWDDALEDACDALEAMARQRAMAISDGLLMFLLRAHRPHVYRDTFRHELTDGQGGPLHLRVEVVGDRAPEPPALPPATDLVALPLPYEVPRGGD